jgi:hypothetical protein
LGDGVIYIGLCGGVYCFDDEDDDVGGSGGGMNVICEIESIYY